jgi:hypothetical protein
VDNLRTRISTIYHPSLEQKADSVQPGKPHRSTGKRAGFPGRDVRNFSSNPAFTGVQELVRTGAAGFPFSHIFTTKTYKSARANRATVAFNTPIGCMQYSKFGASTAILHALAHFSLIKTRATGETNKILW